MGKTILIVGDDRDASAALGEILARDGYLT